MRVALDSLGDFPLEPLVTGAVTAARANPDLRILFLGDERRLGPLLQGLGKVGHRLDTFPCSQWLTFDDPPDVHRVKPDASLLRGWQLLLERNVEALVTTGPPQALYATAIRWRSLLPNVRAPMLAAFGIQPGAGKMQVAAGNHPAPRADLLYQWGVMGLLLAQQLETHDAPKLRLASTMEQRKVIEEALRYFRESPWHSACTGASDVRESEGNAPDVTVTLTPAPVAFNKESVGCIAGNQGVALFAAPTEPCIQRALGLAGTWLAVNLNQKIIDELAHGPL